MYGDTSLLPKTIKLSTKFLFIPVFFCRDEQCSQGSSENGNLSWLQSLLHQRGNMGVKYTLVSDNNE